MRKAGAFESSEKNFSEFRWAIFFARDVFWTDMDHKVF